MFLEQAWTREHLYRCLNARWRHVLSWTQLGLQRQLGIVQGNVDHEAMGGVADLLDSLNIRFSEYLLCADLINR